MSDRHDDGTGDLTVRPQVLHAILVDHSQLVRLFQVFRIVRDTVSRHALEKDVLDPRPHAPRVVDGEVVGRAQEALFRLNDDVLDWVGVVGFGVTLAGGEILQGRLVGTQLRLIAASGVRG